MTASPGKWAAGEAAKKGKAGCKAVKKAGKARLSVFS